MAVNRFYKGTPYQASLYVPPVDFIAKALEATQKQYDVNYEAAEKLRNKYIESVPADRARANSLQDEWDKKIDNAVSKYGQDYSQIGSELQSITREMNKQFSPGGEAEAIQRRYNLIQDSLKRARESAKAGKVNSSEVSLLENFYNRQGPTTYDPTTQTYSQPEIIELPETFKVQQAFQEYYKTVPKREINTKVYTGKKTIDGYLEFKEEKKQFIDPNEVSAGWEAVLNTNTEYINWANTLEKLSGSKPGEITRAISDDYNQNIIPGLSGMLSTTENFDYKEDWRRKAATEDMYARRRMVMKHQMENPPTPMTPSRLTVSESSTPKFPTIPLETASGWKLLETGNVGDFFNRNTQKMTVARAMSDPSMNVNKQLLQSIRDENPNATDDQILTKYNQSVENMQYSAGIDYLRFETTAAQEEEANRLLPLLKANTVRVWRIGADGKKQEVLGDARKTLGASFEDTEKPNSSKVMALGKSFGYSGHVPSASTIFSDPSGGRDLYVVEDPRTDLVKINKVREKAFKFLQTGQEIGDYFEMYSGSGTPVGLIGTNNYVNGELRPVFYTARYLNGKLQVNYNDPVLNEDGSYSEPYDIEMMMIPEDVWRSTLPRKTKPAYENEIQ